MSTAAFDLVIVGAGPAGAAAALGALAADPTARVALVDRAAFPRDKVCGEGLTTTSVAVLGELGVADVLADARPVEELSLTSPNGGSMRARLGLPAYVLARRVLDARIVAAAVARGARLYQGRVRRDRGDGRWQAQRLIATLSALVSAARPKVS